MALIKSATKRYLRNFPILVKIKKIIWKIANLTKPSPISDKNYFVNKFSNHHNINSISFDIGIVEGRFRETSFLLNIRPQSLIESYIFLNGIWEPYIAELIASYLNTPNVAVIDVGANIGATSIPLAKHFTKVNFFLFEPHPVVFNCLKHNISFNKLSNVEAHNIAITNNDQEFAPFYAQKNANNLGLSSFNLNHDIEEYELIQVKCQSLDSAFNSEMQVKIIKIDTQGHELKVLLGAKRLISNHRPIIFFEFESEYFKDTDSESETREELMKFFEQINYELYMIDYDSKFFPKITLNGYFHGDILAIPLHNLP